MTTVPDSATNMVNMFFAACEVSHHVPDSHALHGWLWFVAPLHKEAVRTAIVTDQRYVAGDSAMDLVVEYEHVHSVYHSIQQAATTNDGRLLDRRSIRLHPCPCDTCVRARKMLEK